MMAKPWCVQLSDHSSLLGSSGLRVPVAFKIRNQPIAEVAEGLLLGEKGKVLPKQIQRLLSDSELASIADGTHDSRGREIFNDLSESAVNLIGRGNLVAN